MTEPNEAEKRRIDNSAFTKWGISKPE